MNVDSNDDAGDTTNSSPHTGRSRDYLDSKIDVDRPEKDPAEKLRKLESETEGRPARATGGKNSLEEKSWLEMSTAVCHCPKRSVALAQDVREDGSERSAMNIEGNWSGD